MKPVKKAVIPTAGWGTRLLPATKSLPKAMLPIVDKPTIHYIVEEALEAGIEEILIVSSNRNASLSDYFSANPELEQVLRQKNKTKELEALEGIPTPRRIRFIEQPDAMGLGHAVACARSEIGDEPFAVLLGDIIFPSRPPCLTALIEGYAETGQSCIGVKAVDWNDVHQYGIVDGSVLRPGFLTVKSLIEKPKSKPPTNLAILGRYVFTPELFEELEHVEPDGSGEIQLTDAIARLTERQGCTAFVYEGDMYDVGNKLGALKATTELALRHDKLKQPFADYLHRRIRQIEHSKEGEE